MTLVSAHRGGGGDGLRENSLEAIETAIALGCDYVEFDVRLTADGRAVLQHDPLDGTGDPVTLEDALAAVRGRIGAHLDLKVRDREIAVVRRAVEVLGTDRLLVTTSEDRDVRDITAWAASAAPGLLVGLSTGSREVTGRPGDRWRVRLESLLPRTRMRRSGAGAVVSHHVLARWWMRSWARRRGLPLVVWTVDADRDLARWVHDPHTWLVTTNRPARALALREVSSP